MHYIVEDPWPLGLALGGFAVLCLLALWLTGRGRFLIWAGVAGGLIAVLIGVDALWVTVDERIEAVVLDLARAAGRGNSEAVLDLLTDDVILSQGSVPVIEPAPDSDTPIDGQLARGKAAREAIAATLQDTSFDFIHVGNLQPHAEPERRVGVADFRIYTSGSIRATYNYNFATDAQGSDWSLGFREVEPDTWQVSRITAVRLPFGAQLPLVRPSR